MISATKDYWIQTLSGKKFSYIDPQPEDICKQDIITALSREPRYAGHTFDRYTVGQHSCYCCSQACYSCPVLPDVNYEIARQAFAHDFAEAYTGDLPHPLKKLIRDMSGGDWTIIENNITEVICAAVGVVYPFMPEVKEIDLRMLATERVYQLAEPPAPWGCNDAPYDFEIVVWDEEGTKECMESWWEDLELFG